MLTSVNEALNNALFEYCIRLGDDRLILGHRLSQLCGHAPILEEDMAITNIALDLIGQANNFLDYAGTVENKGRSADNLAYLRNESDFKNLLLVEQENNDYAYVITRQFFFDTFSYNLFEELCNSKDERISALAHRTIKEVKYHLRHSSEWVLRLGDGTEESRNRMIEAIDYYSMYVGEMFEINANDSLLINEGIACDLKLIKDKWFTFVNQIFEKATLPTINPDIYMQYGGRQGKHTECLGHLLAEMQILPRTYVGAEW